VAPNVPLAGRKTTQLVLTSSLIALSHLTVETHAHRATRTYTAPNTGVATACHTRIVMSLARVLAEEMRGLAVIIHASLSRIPRQESIGLNSVLVGILLY